MSFVLWNPQDVTVTRHADTEVSDGAGGFLDNAPSAIYSGQCDVVISKQINEHRDEADPGIVTQKIRKFQFLKPVSFQGIASYFKPQDRIAWDGEIPGEVYVVQFVWVFDDVVVCEGWVMQ